MSNLSKQVIQKLEASRKKERPVKMNLDFSEYQVDIDWYNSNIIPGLITWVKTIDPLLFLRFISIHIAAGNMTTDTPILLDQFGEYSWFSGTLETIKTLPDDITALRVAARGTSSTKLPFHKFIEEHYHNVMNQVSKEPPRTTPIFILPISNADAMLQTTVNSLKYFYNRAWGTSIVAPLGILPLGVPKIIIVPMNQINVPSYLKRVALSVNFDEHVGNSPYVQELRRLELYYKSNGDKLDGMAFPATFMEQTAAISPTTKNVTGLLSKSLLNSTNGLKSITNPTPLEEIGAFDYVKNWAKTMSKFMASTHYKSSERPRGILLVGPPGSGKTVIASALSSVFGWTGVELDISEMIGGVQGETENNLAVALNTIRQINKCVVLVDEVEKALGGTQSSSKTDGGVLLRVLNGLLRFMEENTHNAIMVMTANSVDELPPPLLRSGRLDMVLLADVPTAPQRKEILTIHLNKRNLGALVEKTMLEKLSKLTNHFSGAELRELIARLYRKIVVDDLFDMLDDGPKLFKLIDNIRKTVLPIAESKSEEIQLMREWAQKHALDAHTGKKPTMNA